MSLTSKTALITGGAKNLGAQIARELAACGANLAIHYNSPSSEADARKLEAELRGKYPSIKIAIYRGDLTAADAVTKLFDETLREFGSVNVVVNTVGKVLKKPILEISEGEHGDMFAYVPFFPFGFYLFRWRRLF
jgi:NAD(P)-dependent dehydrogenase (short-subunit alcohol dehydrogenase family)